MRFNWVHVRLAAIDADEMRDLVEGAWAMCVPKRVAAEYAASQGYTVELLTPTAGPSPANAFAGGGVGSLRFSIPRVYSACARGIWGSLCGRTVTETAFRPPGDRRRAKPGSGLRPARTTGS
jgi:hypothetical protein